MEPQETISITYSYEVPRSRAGRIACEGNYTDMCVFLRGVEEYWYSCGFAVDIDEYAPMPREGCPFLAAAEAGKIPMVKQ